MFKGWRKKSDKEVFDLEAHLANIRSEVAVSPKHWDLMYRPMFDCLVSFNLWFKPQHEVLIKQACAELPSLIRRSKATVTDDIHEIHIKNFLTVSVYISLKMASAACRYETWLTKNDADIQVLPFLGATSHSDELVVVRKRKRSWPPGIVASRAFHLITNHQSVAVWLYKFPGWLQVAYQELSNNGELGKIFDFGQVSFDDPFNSGSIVQQPEPPVMGHSEPSPPQPATTPPLFSPDDVESTSILDLVEDDSGHPEKEETPNSSDQVRAFEEFLKTPLKDRDDAEKE